MSQFVDQNHLRAAGQNGRQVELGETAAAVVDVVRRDDLDSLQELRGLGAAVGLDHRGHQVGAAFQPPMRFTEHGEGLPHPGRCSQIDAQFAAPLLGAGRGG